MKTCRCCARPLEMTPDTYVGAQITEGISYLALFVCAEPTCHAGFAVPLWEADDQEQLLDDTAPMLSAARDNREDDAA